MDSSHEGALRRLVAESECRALSWLYCRHLDHLDPAAFADLWIDDGIYKPAALDHAIRGRAAIRDWADAYPGRRLGRHLSTNQLVQVVDDHRATGTSYSVVFREPDPMPGRISGRVTPRSVVEYADSYELTDAGWRFASRTYTYAFLEG